MPGYQCFRVNKCQYAPCRYIVNKLNRVCDKAKISYLAQALLLNIPENVVCKMFAPYLRAS
jgi:hypothetical protein